MNFLCDKCKQKYHVGDEKVRGRDVVRFKCKKCEHVIEVRPGVNATLDGESGSAGGESIASSPPPASPASTAAASNRMPLAPRTGVGSAPAAPAAGLRSAGAGALPTRSPTGTSLPTTPARSPLSPAAPARSPTGTGLPTSGGLRPLGSPLGGPARPPTGTGLPTAAVRAAGLANVAAAPAATRSPTASRLPTAPATTARSIGVVPATSGAANAPLRKALATRAEPAPGPSASQLLNASETGWYAGIRDLPVGPLTRGEMSSKVEAGEITPDTLVWREGLDDWRPLRDVDELGSLVRATAQKISGGLLGDMGRREPAAASAKIVPIAKSPARGGFDDVADDEPTRVSSVEEMATAAEAKGATGLAGVLRGEPAPSRAPVSAPAPSAPIVAPAPARAPAPSSAPVAATFGLPAPAPTPGPAPLAPLAPAPPPSELAAPAAPLVAASLASERPPPRERRGVPVGIWILMGGVLIVGVAIGLFLRNPPSRTQSPAERRVVRPAPAVQRATREVGAEIALPTNDPTPAPAPTAPVEIAPAAPAANAAAASSGSTGGHRTPASTGRAVPGRGLSAEQQALLNAQLGVGGSAGPVSAPVTAALRPGGGGAAAASSGGNEGLTGSARAESVLDAFNRSRVVNDCWNTALRRNPAHPREAFRVRLDVNPSGRASVGVTGSNDPELARCIQQRASARPFGAGGSVTADQSVTLAPGE